METKHTNKNKDLSHNDKRGIDLHHKTYKKLKTTGLPLQDEDQTKKNKDSKYCLTHTVPSPPCWDPEEAGPQDCNSSLHFLTSWTPPRVCRLAACTNTSVVYRLLPFT